MAQIWFTVGRLGGHRSAMWQLWTRGDAAYVLHHGTQEWNHRFSFSRRNTNCRWVEVSPLRARMRMPILEWTRDPVPPLGSGLGCLLITVVFPTSHLAPADAPAHDSIHWIDPAPPGWAVRLEFVLAHQPQSAVCDPLRLDLGQRLLFSHPWQSDLRVYAIASTFDCGPVELTLPQRPNKVGQSLGEILLPGHDEYATGRPIRVVLVGDDVRPPDIWELSGYAVSRP